MRLNTFAATLLLPLAALPAKAEPVWPAAAKVSFISPADGVSISGPLHGVMGLSGLGVAPAGVDQSNTGHHHLLVAGELPKGAAMMEPMIADDHFRHFGGGQTQTDLALPAGTHTLQLIVGDQNHIPHDPALVSDKITVK